MLKVSRNFRKLDKIADFIVHRFQGLTKDAISKSIQKKRDEIRRNIRSGGVPTQKLHPFTIWMKKSRKPLIDTGTLLNSIIVDELEDDNNILYYAGVDPFATVDGKSLLMIAARLEYGSEYPNSPQFITDRMRAFLLSRGLVLRKETKYLILPPRPFIRPAFKNIDIFLASNIRKKLVV